MTNGGELFKLARERRESEDQILDSVRESVLAELEGLASEAKQFVQQFETRVAAIVARARGLVDSGENVIAEEILPGNMKEVFPGMAKLEAGGRLPQGSTLTDMHELDRQLSAIVEGSRYSDSPFHRSEDEVKKVASAAIRPEIIAVRDGRD